MKTQIEKSNTLKNGNLLFAFFANNAGRGSDNCTLMVVKSGTKRGYNTRSQKNVISECRTSAWRGNVNFSKNVAANLGISKSDVVNPVGS